MPGPLYGFSKKEVKRVKRRTKRGQSLQKARGDVLTSRPAPKLSSYSKGFRRLVRTEIRDRKDAKQVLRKYGVGVEGPFTPGQKTFIETLAKETGLSAKVIGAWALAEQSGSAAQQREAEGNHNWLNIGYYDSGPNQGITADSVFGNPKRAARAIAETLKGGGFNADPSIVAIMKTVGKSDQAQMNAIVRSKWASSHYGGSLADTYSQVGARTPNVPKVQAARKELKQSNARLKQLGALRLVAKPEKVATIVKIGKIAQQRFGLRVSENAAFDGGVTPTSGHAQNSFHYSNAAIDVSGDPAKMLAFDKFVARKFGKDLEELFYDPGVSIDNGQVTSPIGGHSDHVHVAETTGASAGLSGPFPSGGSVPSGSGTGNVMDFSAPVTEAEKRLRRRVRNIKNRPLARTSTSSPSADLASTGVPRSISNLAKKYGVGL